MKQNTMVALCAIASIGAVVAGFALMLAALSPKRTSEWGEVAAGFTPQAILIAGGLMALAICSAFRRDRDGRD